MPKPLTLSNDRLFPAEPSLRAIARGLYATVRDLPIVSPHGHTDAGWFASNAAFSNATELLLAPDHYLYRMLHSQGVPLERLGVRRARGRRRPIRAKRGDCLRSTGSCFVGRRRRCG